MIESILVTVFAVILVGLGLLSLFLMLIALIMILFSEESL